LCNEAESGINRIVTPRGSAPAVDPPRSEPEAEPLLLLKKIQLEENTASHLKLFRGVIRRLAG
jgi:hypothetical protein